MLRLLGGSRAFVIEASAQHIKQRGKVNGFTNTNELRHTRTQVNDRKGVFDDKTRNRVVKIYMSGLRKFIFLLMMVSQISEKYQKQNNRTYLQVV